MIDDITTAKKELEAAIQAMIPRTEPGDKSELKKTVTIAKGYDLTKYVDDANKENFLTVLERAEAVCGDEGVAQDAIDEAWRNLLDAMVALRLRADKQNLITWLEELKAIDLSKYTEESALAVKEAIANVEALASQDLGTDQEALIRLAIAQMELSKENLVLKDDAPSADPDIPDNASSALKDNTDSTKPSDSSSSSGADAGGSTTKTGDGALPVVLLLAAAGLVCAAYQMRTKRSKQED